MRFFNSISLYIYKLIVLIFLFPIGGILIISTFGNNIIGSFFFGSLLLLLSIIKFNELLKDPDFDFNTFVLVILIIPIIIDFVFKANYLNFHFFDNIDFTYNVLKNYIYLFFDNYLS